MYKFEEYDSLIRCIIDLVENELSLYTRNLILYGSYERVYKKKYDTVPPIIAGTSDVDLVLILDVDDVDPEKPFRRYKKLQGIISNLQLEPIYATLLDLTIIEANSLPPLRTDNFTPLHAESAQHGTVLYGKNSHNILEDLYFSKSMLEKSAAAIVRSNYESIRNAYLQQGLLSFFQSTALEFIASDSVLETAHALMTYVDKTDLVRLEVPDAFIDSSELQEYFNSQQQTVQRAMELKLGTSTTNSEREDFIIDAIRFCRTASRFVRSPFSKAKVGK